MKTKIAAFCFITLLSSLVKVQAQEERNHGIIWSSLHGLEYEIKAGFNVGGVSPLPLPEEIRALTSYRPTVCISIEGNVTKWLSEDNKWGMMLGVRIDNKGMEAGATTKNYGMEIIGDGGERLKGNWTGNVRTKFKASYLSIPVLAAYRLNSRCKLSAGPYVSFMTGGDFFGHVSDGYLRKDTPTGTKVEFKDGKTAPYDFSNSLQKTQWGAQAGVEWKAFKHLNVYADLLWGLNDIFKKDFNTITFNMYPVYLNVGFGYSF